MQREHPGDGGEQPGAVGRRDGDRPGDRLVRLGHHGQPAGRDQGGLRRGQRGRRRRRCAVQTQCGPAYQVVHEPRLPLAPRGRPGGQRVGPGQGRHQLEHLGGAELVGDRGDGRRVVQVAPGGVLDEQQVVPDDEGERRDVVGVEAHPGGDRHRERLPRLAVVAGGLGALADVVQQGPDEQQVRAVHLAHQRDRLHGRLQQVPVDGCSGAPRCAAAGAAPGPTRAAAGRSGRPGRAPPRPAPAAARRRAARRTGAGRSPATAAAAAGCRRPAGRPSSATAAARRGPRGRPSAARAAGRYRGSAWAVSTASPSCSARPGPSSRSTGLRPRTNRDRCGRVACSARRQVTSAAWVIAAADPPTSRSRASASARPRSAATWSCSCSCSRLVARPVTSCSASRTSASRRTASSTSRCGRSATQDAATARSDTTSRSPPRPSLRSGSRSWRRSPDLRAPLVPGRAQLGQPAAGGRAPVAEDAAAQAADQRRVAGDRPRVEQAEQHGRGRCWPAGGPPRRCAPRGPGARRCPRPGTRSCPRASADDVAVGVQQHQVQVAARGQLAAAVAADGDQGGLPGRYAGGRDRVGEHLAQPRVGQGRQALAAHRAPGTGAVALGQQLAAPGRVVRRQRGSRHGCRPRAAARLRARRRHARPYGPARRCPPGSTRPCRRRSGRSAPTS